MPSSLNLETPISELHRYLPRVGEVTARKLARGLARQTTTRTTPEATVEDLLLYLPMRYEDRSRLTRISELEEGMEASLELFTKVAGGYEVRSRRASSTGRLFIFEITAIDPSKSGRPVVVWWFISGTHARDIVNYYLKRFTRGSRFITFGRWEWDSRRATYSLRVQRPAEELEMLPTPGVEMLSLDDDEDEGPAEEGLGAIHVGRRVPIYRKLGELNSKRLREIIHALLNLVPARAIADKLPSDLVRRQHLLSRAQALREIHFPPDKARLPEYEDSRSQAHLRLIFEEFFWLSLGLQLKRGERVKEKKSVRLKIDTRVKDSIASVLPFKLTEAQRRVVRDIFTDMKSDAPMNRLLQGDVGSGKTVVALIAMMAALENNLQAGLMVPTEILAEQHARTIKKLLARTPYRVELLTGSIRAAQKKKLQSDLAAGEIHALIGTHALIQENVKFHRLGLVVIDEQHRFGVMQRAELRARGLNPDVLVMTATPIPRSLAMTVYGDLDVSVIDELPPGRTPVETLIFADNPADRQRVKELITRELRSGRQAYVVYPLVEESEKMDLRDATQRFEYLRDKVFPKFKVGLVHGKLKSIDKDHAMKAFVAGEIQILVSTTVIEVGVDVPNASVMVVEHAERFGLSQLHQLRGRVGRGAERSYCLLLSSEKKTSIAEERLGIMVESNDGFIIAEKDLELRGAGELLGTRQSGLPEFKIGNLVRDQQILHQAKREAEYYLQKREKSLDTQRMIKIVQADPRFGLAVVG